MALAIFDLDETLIADDSDHAWGEFIADRGLVDADAHRRQNEVFFEAYKRGDLDIHAYLRFACKVLAEHDVEFLNELRREFFDERIRPMLLDRAEALIESHRERGDTLIIVTATAEFVTRPIAEHYGIDTLIAPIPEVRDGRYTGEIVGTPSFREGKVTRINEWLTTSAETLEGSYCYSDSHNDVPMLELATYPHAVDPDPKLESIARERQWPIISLRES